MGSLKFLLLAFFFIAASLIPAHAADSKLTVNEFSRDRTVFDTGGVIGLNTATIPLSGTSQGPDGDVIQARVVNAEDGSEVLAWSNIATVTGGEWSGQLNELPRNQAWLRVEARSKADPQYVVRMENTFGAGFVWALYEQSNWARLFSPSFSKTKPDALIAPGDVQIFTLQRKAGEITRTLITDETPLSAAVVAFANAFSAERPGEKLALAAHVQSGTSPIDMIDAPEVQKKQREWKDEVALHQAITADGSPVGLVTVNGWIAFNGGRPSNDDIIVPIVTQKLVDGTPVVIGDALKVSGDNFTLVHCLTELYDWNYTRFTFIGPHGRAQSGNVDGYLSRADQDYEQMVDDWRATLSNPAFPEFLPFSFETQGALRGVAKGKDWTDIAHHSANNKDGLERLARLGMAATLKSANLVTWPIPVFDHVYWAPDGSSVDFWMEGYNITTERLRRGMEPIPGTFPHRTEVMGFSINGMPAHRAEIIADAGGSSFAGVRVYPNEGKFDSSQDVQYGLGKQVGLQVSPDDFEDAYYLNLPVANVGQADLPALPMSPRSTQALPKK